MTVNHPSASVESNPKADLARQIIDQVDRLIQESLQENKPLEVDPARGRLFELFAMADGSGLLVEGGDPDLTADEFCKTLANRWGLDSAARKSVAQGEKIPEDHLAKMRGLWAFLRMWMEWTYAWERWAEFHSAPGDEGPL